jgi:hypothetical protein
MARNKEAANRGGLLLLVRVKLGLIGNCVSDQFIEPIDRQLIGDGRCESPVLL